MLKDIQSGAHLGHKPKLKYRPDIDGLRAVAVLSVVFFHAGFSWFSGGYVGVDLFFVLSGFLITKIILSDLKKERFSIKVFYERRIKRLFPALFAHLIAILIAAYFILLPSDIILLGENIVATSLFIANIFFCLEAGYFGPTSHELPLLHTWSLAVEEQFYIFWPILLWLTYKLSLRSIKALLIVGMISSLGIAQFWVLTKTHWAFYLFPARSFELMIGSWLAFPFAPKLENPKLAAPLSWLGVAGICLPFFLMDNHTPFPGLAALPVCLGTAILIVVGQNHKTTVQRFLENKWCIFIGLLSYSLYLWHWPIFSMGRYALDRSFHIEESMLAIACSFLLAFLSWKYVEAPFRHSKSPRLLHYGVVTIILSCGIGWWLSDANRIESMYETQFFKQDQSISVLPPLQAPCNNPPNNRPPSNEKCSVGHGERVTAVLWGDSHGNHFGPMLQDIAEEKSFRFTQITKDGCLPFIGIARTDFSPGNQKACQDLTKNTISHLKEHPEITTVYLAARWGSHAERSLFGEEEGPIPVWETTEKTHEDIDDSNNHQAFTIGLTKTIEKLNELGKKVVILEQTPEFGYSSGKCHLKSQLYGLENQENKCHIPKSQVTERQNFFISELRLISNRFDNVEHVNILDHLCHEDWCPPEKDNVLLYKDDDHLSVPGSQWLAQQLKDTIPLPN